MRSIQIFTILFFLFPFFGNSQTVWKTFDHKNGFTIQLPSSFSEGLLVAGGTLQWYNDTLNKQIEITVETFGNATPGHLQDDFNDMQTTFNNVTYKVLRPTWYVISGVDDEGICYFKTILKNGTLHHLRITYPETEKKNMEEWIPKISSSFK